MKGRPKLLLSPEDRFVLKGWIPTDQGLWRKVKSTEAYIQFHDDEDEEDEVLYEFTIQDPRGINWLNSGKVLKEMDEMLPSQ